MAAKKRKAPKPKMASGANGYAILVRLSEAEYEALSWLASDAGVTRSGWLRAKIHRAGGVVADDRRPGPGRPAGEDA